MSTGSQSRDCSGSSDSGPPVTKSLTDISAYQVGERIVNRSPRRRRVGVAVGIVGLFVFSAFGTPHLYRIINIRKYEMTVGGFTKTHRSNGVVESAILKSSSTSAQPAAHRADAQITPTSPIRPAATATTSIPQIDVAHKNDVSFLTSSFKPPGSKIYDHIPKKEPRPRAVTASVVKPPPALLTQPPLPAVPETKPGSVSATAITPIIFPPSEDPNESELRLLRERNLNYNR